MPGQKDGRQARQPSDRSRHKDQTADTVCSAGILVDQTEVVWNSYELSDKFEPPELIGVIRLAPLLEVSTVGSRATVIQIHPALFTDQVEISPAGIDQLPVLIDVARADGILGYRGSSSCGASVI